MDNETRGRSLVHCSFESRTPGSMLESCGFRAVAVLPVSFRASNTELRWTFSQHCEAVRARGT